MPDEIKLEIDTDKLAEIGIHDLIKLNTVMRAAKEIVWHAAVCAGDDATKSVSLNSVTKHAKYIGAYEALIAINEAIAVAVEQADYQMQLNLEYERTHQCH